MTDIMVREARTSFVNLGKQLKIINGVEAKPGTKLILDPEIHAEAIAAIKNEIAKITNEELKGAKLPSDKYCLRNGDDLSRPEYEGMFVLSTSSTDRPKLIGRNKQILNPEDNEVYSGCYANAKVSLWAQDNQYGRRINCNLIAIQFAKDGEALSGRHVSDAQAAEGFDSLDGDDDDFLTA